MLATTSPRTMDYESPFCYKSLFCTYYIIVSHITLFFVSIFFDSCLCIRTYCQQFCILLYINFVLTRMCM